jgi:pimeloyl-ACP methyl ester carboxylesterase
LLVGHSIAGDELTWLGGHHAEAFSGLVYLDAAYDRSGDGHDARNLRLRELNRRLPAEPPIPVSAMISADAFNQYLVAQGHTRMPEGELIAFFNLGKPFLAGTPNIDVRSAQAIKAAIRPPDYASVRVPALAIYAFDGVNAAAPPWLGADDIGTFAEMRKLEAELKRENLERFRRGVANDEVLALEDASHYVFQSKPQQVIEKVREFAQRR